MNKRGGNTIVWLLIAGAIVTFFVFRNNKNDSNSSETNNFQYRSIGYSDDRETIDRQDVIDEYWDEIKDYINGSETIDACSFESGNCYSLDADISNGEIESIYFPNGGYLYFSADIDEDGDASDYDSDGNSWDFTFDMDSSTVDDAIYDWASDNDYEIE